MDGTWPHPPPTHATRKRAQCSIARSGGSSFFSLQQRRQQPHHKESSQNFAVLLLLLLSLLPLFTRLPHHTRRSPHLLSRFSLSLQGFARGGRKAKGRGECGGDEACGGEARQGLFDWLSTQGVQYIKDIESAINTQLAKDRQKVDEWYATGGGQDELDAVNRDIDHLESLMLEGLGTAPTDFTISLSPKEYGRILVGKLVIQTEKMMWSYEVRGKPPRYSKPKNVRSKVVSTRRVGIIE